MRKNTEDMTENDLSKSVEDFLKAVYVLQQQMERVSTNALADALSILPPSVTDMARRMADAELVEYQKYRGVILTTKGEAVALRVIRRHRLIELYLVEELDYKLHEVHDEAEKLEHAVSERFIEAISHKLGDPQIDPHGDPIPAADGTMLQRTMIALSELEVNTPAIISRFTAESSEMLQHILDRDFKLNEAVRVIARDPFNGPITALVGTEERVIGHNVATHILVERT